MIIALTVVLATAVTACADMVPASPVDTAPYPSAPVCKPANPQPAGSHSTLLGPVIVDLDLRSPASLPTARAEAEETRESRQPVRLLGLGRSSSLDLCLYAFMGLGLCRSAPWVKKLSGGCALDWYHAGGPHQIGHSHAAERSCLCSAAVCLVQPDCGAEDSIPRHRVRAIAAHWRKSQFTPTVLACRGPPLS